MIDTQQEIKLIPLNEYIEYINELASTDYLKLLAYDNIVEYSTFLDTPLELNMFIGEDKLFEENFVESNCWEYGCDNHLKGQFVKLINPKFGYEDFVIHLEKRNIAWWITYMDKWSKPTDYCIEKYRLNKLFIFFNESYGETD